MRQDRLEPVTLGGVQHGLDSFRTIRLLRQARHAPCVQGMEDMTDGWDGTSPQLRNGLGGQPPGTREDDWRPPDTEGLCGASVGLQLHTFIISDADREADRRWLSAEAEQADAHGRGVRQGTGSADEGGGAARLPDLPVVQQHLSEPLGATVAQSRLPGKAGCDPPPLC